MMPKPMPIETAPARGVHERPARILSFCGDDKEWLFGRVTEFSDPPHRIVSGNGRTGDWIYTHWLPVPDAPE